MAGPVLQLQGVVAAVTTGNLTVTIPAGELADDILVVTTVAWVVNTATGANTIAAPSGWTKYTPDVTTITSTLIDAEYSFFWRRAVGGTETDPTFVRPAGWDTGNDTAWAGRCYVIRGAITTGDPWDEIGNTAISTVANPAFPAITVSGDERLAIVFAVKTDNTALPTAATGYTVGTVLLDATGTDSAFNSYRQTTNSSVSAVTPTGGVAPAQGGTVYFEVSFKPPAFAVVDRTADGSGTGTESASGLRIVLRTADGSGTGTESADGLRTVVISRTATGSGVGTESSTELRTVLVTATGSGLGTETAVGLVTQPSVDRTATGSGSGTESATNVTTRLRTATGSGAGLGTGSWVIIRIRTATGLGTGTSTSVGARVVVCIATGSGAGTESDAGWVKSHIFRVPYTITYSQGTFRGEGTANRLQSYNRSGVRALNLYHLTDDSYTTVEQRDAGQILKLWHGGRDHFLTDAEVTELTAAGFGASIT